MMIDSQAGLPWGWETLGMTAPNVSIHTWQSDFVVCPVGPIISFSHHLGLSLPRAAGEIQLKAAVGCIKLCLDYRGQQIVQNIKGFIPCSFQQLQRCWRSSLQPRRRMGLQRRDQVTAGPPSPPRVAAVTCGSSPQAPEEVCLPVEATWGGKLCFVFSRLQCGI